MSDALTMAREIQARLYSDAALAKDRDEYIRTVANYNDISRLVLMLESCEPS